MADVSAIIAFEDGSLSGEGVVTLFSDLVKTGQAWQLQGFYGRTARGLIEAGYLDRQGNILRLPALEEDDDDGDE